MSTNGDLRAQQHRQLAATDNSWNAWFATGFNNHLNAAMQRSGLVGDVIAKVLALHRQGMRDEYEPKIAALEKKVQELEHKLSLDTRLAEMERGLDARQAGRDAAKRGSKGEQGERGARGERGPRGDRGPKGEPGLAAAQVVGWKVDRKSYRCVPFYSDGKFGPAIELRDLFEQFFNEVEGNK